MIFKDRHGREWNLFISLETAYRIDMSDFSRWTEKKLLMNSGKQDFLDELFMNRMLMFAFIYAIVKPQVLEKLKLPPATDPEPDDDFLQRKFMDGINGQAIEDATTALVMALSDFFPAAKMYLLTLAEKLETVRKKILQKQGELLPKIDLLIDKELDTAMKRIDSEMSSLVGETSN